MKKRIIPKNRIKYQRFGQLIYNAIYYVNRYKDNIEMIDKEICNTLFYTENDELEKLIQDYLKGVK